MLYWSTLHHRSHKNTAIKTTTAATVYEALKSAERKDEVDQYCKEDYHTVFAVRDFLKTVLKNGVDYYRDNSVEVSLEKIADGLSRFRKTAPNFVSLDDDAVKFLLYIYRMCPALGTPKASSSISSNGTLVTVDLDFDETHEKAAYRVALAAALEAAKKHSSGMNSTEFGDEAKKIFNTENDDYKAAFKHVVPDNCGEGDSWTGTNEAATAISLMDAMTAEATSAFSTWGKLLSAPTFDMLFMHVFKRQACP